MKSLFPIKYKIKGVVLDAADLSEVNEYYEAACTAEYIYENYKVTEQEALRLGYDVRRLMSKYECTEEDAVYEVCNKNNIKRGRRV